MANIARDQQIALAFAASLRGELPPASQDPAITAIVQKLVAGRADHAVKSARLQEFRSFDLYGASGSPTPLPAPKGKQKAVVVEKGDDDDEDDDEEVEVDAEEAAKKAKALAAKRASNVAAAKRMREKQAKNLQDLQAKLKDLGGGEGA